MFYFFIYIDNYFCKIILFYFIFKKNSIHHPHQPNIFKTNKMFCDITFFFHSIHFNQPHLNQKKKTQNDTKTKKQNGHWKKISES